MPKFQVLTKTGPVGKQPNSNQTHFHITPRRFCVSGAWIMHVRGTKLWPAFNTQCPC